MTGTQDPDTQDYAAMIDAITDGWVSAMGIRFTRATKDEVVAELVVGPVHRQPLGIVHGGVHAGLIEAIASVGASLGELAHGRMAVGLENHTSFLHAVREGRLRGVGRPVQRGGRTHVWDVNVLDEKDRVVATGRVRLLVIAEGSPLGGAPAKVGG